MTDAEHPPSVDALARSLADTGLPHPLLVEAARESIAAGRHHEAHQFALARQRRMLQPVINATGVLLHTNLGRAPWPTEHPARYLNLEFDLTTGRRGSRQDAVGELFADLCGAEAAMVVNNCAAAVTLVLAALAEGRGVAVSRGELVEIGGGFRVPEVMERSGATLVEVGTTNRTRLADYAGTLGRGEPDVALALKVHQSNYRITGFTESVEVGELASLDVPVVADIGSGLLDAACPWLSGGPPDWLADEPAARQTIAAGADIVMFSGDKLLGGPQAGIIAGSADLVACCAAHPLARAFRPGGLVLSSLHDLALRYLDRDGASIPFWAMATLPVDGLRERAERLGCGTPTALSSVIGGGTLPGVEIPSAGVVLPGDHTAKLRSWSPDGPPVIARVHEGTTHLDLRTVDPDDDATVTAAVAATPAA
jgi:L-seryl-tRNA(Ser) seleniumtransferase